MSLTPTLILLVVCLAAVVFTGWRGARPPDVARGRPRMAPWRFLMLLSGALTFFVLIHLATLLGLKHPS